MTLAARPPAAPVRRVRTPAARERDRIRGPLLTAGALAAALLVVDLVAGGGGSHHELRPGPLALASALSGWLLMVTAMTAPLLGPPLRHVHARSLGRSRTRAHTLFLSGFALVWTLAGIVLLLAATALRTVPAAPLVVAGTALLWLGTPARQRCLNRRHRHPPLPVFGRAAGWAAARFGLVHGMWCLGTCWAAMLLMLLLPGLAGLAVMLAATAWLAAESLEPPARPRWGIRLPRAAIRISSTALSGSTIVRAAVRGRAVTVTRR